MSAVPDDAQGRGVAAFFDMDGTLLSQNSGTLYIKKLRRSGKISRRSLARSMVWLARYGLGLAKMEEAWARALAAVAGTSEAETREFCEAWVAEEIVQLVYPRCMALVEKHRALGHEVAVLSASTLYVVEPLCRHIGIEEFICTRLEVENGVFTGRADGVLSYGEGKVELAEAWAEARGVDLARSYFYTDSASDLPMLRAVGEPRVANPDPRLRLVARREGWPVVWFDSGVTIRPRPDDPVAA